MMKLGSATFNALVFSILAFLLFPVAVVVIVSFSSTELLEFPPSAWSLRWYMEIYNDPEWRDALYVSLFVGGASTLIGVLIGVPAAIALTRYAVPGKSLVYALVLGSFITPPIISALGLYLFFAPLGLVNSPTGLILAHSVSALPFIVINTAASLRSADLTLERAAVIHGASPGWAFMHVTLPIISPGVLVGAIFAFAHSIHDLVVAVFLLGGVGKPIAVKLWSSVRAQVDPSIAAASTVLILIAMLAFAGMSLAEAIGRRRRAGAL